MSDSDKKKTDEVTPGETVEKFLQGFSQSTNCPAQLQPLVLKAAPLAGKAVQGALKLSVLANEYYEKAVVEYEKLRPYRLELLLPGLMGLVMCFFGGSFLTLIAAVEAYNLCGYETTANALSVLYDDFAKVVAASKKDDDRDDDNDGVKDVKQIPAPELVKRKTLLFLRTVDPNRLAVAIGGLQAGFLAVVATLKVRFARTIALGNAIGASVEPPVERYVLPLFELALPAEYRKWAKPVLHYSIRTTAISIAWTVQRVISAFHSAIRGGLLFSRNILEYVSKMGIYAIDHEKTYLDEIVGYGLAVLGLFFQLSHGFGLPFPLNILLFPFTIAEYLLVWVVNAN
eukprot:gene11465-12824_t